MVNSTYILFQNLSPTGRSEQGIQSLGYELKKKTFGGQVREWTRLFVEVARRSNRGQRKVTVNEIPVSALVTAHGACGLNLVAADFMDIIKKSILERQKTDDNLDASNSEKDSEETDSDEPESNCSAGLSSSASKGSSTSSSNSKRVSKRASSPSRIIITKAKKGMNFRFQHMLFKSLNSIFCC